MYEPQFGFKRRPFTSVAESSVLFPLESTIQARDTLARVIERAEGPAQLIGPSGVGKTLVCGLLAERFAGKFRVVQLTCGHLGSTRELLQAVLRELRLPYRKLDEGELRLSLFDFLEPSEECPEGLLLLVDEAQHLSVELLEELRLLNNFVRGGVPRVRLVLAGNPRLEETFASPRLESFNQRLAARCYLESMTQAETAEYVRGLTTAAGGRGDDLWGHDSLTAVFRATAGVPRAVNQLCDRALLLAGSERSRRIDSRHVQQAWTDLQQLPAPWNHDDESGATDHAGTDSVVIEFGELDDEPARTARPAAQAPSGSKPRTAPAAPPAQTAQPSECASLSIECGEECSLEVDELLCHQDVVSNAVPADSALQQQLYWSVSDLAPNALERAEQVELRLAEIERSSGMREPPARPLPAATPMLFDDPFGQFSDEEVVIDRCLTLGQTPSTTGARVHSVESRLLAEALATRAEARPRNDQPFEPRSVAGRETLDLDLMLSSSGRKLGRAMDPARHATPRLSEVPASEPEVISFELHDEPRRTPAPLDYDPPTVVPIFVASPDDRELIVVEDDGHEPPENEGVRLVLRRMRGQG